MARDSPTPQRPDTLGLLIGLALGLVVGLVIGVVLALAAVQPTAPTSPGTVAPALTTGGAGTEPTAADESPLPGADVAPTLSPQQFDECLRAAGIDPAGPRPPGAIACALPLAPSSPTPSLVPLTTQPATLPTTR